MQIQPYIVGITGGSASGKTLFLKTLMQHFTDSEICLVSQDNYYRPKVEQPVDNNGVENYDTPHSIDAEQFRNDILALRAGQSVVKKEYTFNNPGAEPKLITLNPAPVIVVEGIFVFYYPEIRNLIDLKVFIEAKEFIKLKRRIVRDQKERGYDLEDVLYRYEYHVSPTFERFIEPFREEADLVVNNNTTFKNGLEVLKIFMQAKISQAGQKAIHTDSKVLNNS